MHNDPKTLWRSSHGSFYGPRPAVSAPTTCTRLTAFECFILRISMNRLGHSVHGLWSLRTAFPICFTGSSVEIDDCLLLDRHAPTGTALFEFTTPFACDPRETVFIAVKRKFSLHNGTDRGSRCAFCIWHSSGRCSRKTLFRPQFAPVLTRFTCR